MEKLNNLDFTPKHSEIDRIHDFTVLIFVEYLE